MGGVLDEARRDRHITRGKIARVGRVVRPNSTPETILHKMRCRHFGQAFAAMLLVRCQADLRDPRNSRRPRAGDDLAFMKGNKSKTTVRREALAIKLWIAFASHA